MTDTLKAFYAGKRILVTGGAGFIGSHVAQALVDLGARVTVLDNFSTGNINNLRAIFSSVTIHYADITSSYSTLKATENKDLVFHLAAFISVPQSVQNPAYCKKINIDGTKNVLRGSAHNGVSHLIFSSSSAVYGNTNAVCSEDSALMPTSPYAESKMIGEQLCKEYATTTNLATTCLRYFNVYGERQSPTSEYAGVVARFKMALLNNQPITIFGDGTQTRDFIEVSEVVRANLMLGCNTASKGEIYNIASGKSINLLQLIEKLEHELKTSRANTQFMPQREGDIQHSTAQCSKYLQALSSVL